MAPGQADLEGDLFPRGRVENSTPRVRKRDGQILFGPQLKRPRQTRPAEEPGVNSSITQQGASLSFSKLSAGMTVLAVVTKSDFGSMELSLPGGVRAVVESDDLLLPNEVKAGKASLKTAKFSDDSDESDMDADYSENLPVPVYETVRKGAIVRAAVIDIDPNYKGRKVARLSLKPDLINAGLNPSHLLKKGFPVYGAIKSIEDHGYIVYFGSGVIHTGFLAFEHCHISQNDHTLSPGTPVEAVTREETILPKKRGKSFSAVVKLSSIRKQVLNSTLESSQGISYQDLSAGMLVKGKVVQKGPGGISLTVFGVFTVGVDASHLPRTEEGIEDVSLGSQVLARIIYVDPALKKIGATLLDTLVSKLTPRTTPLTWKIGTFLKRLAVERIKPGFGLLLRYAPIQAEQGTATHGAETHLGEKEHAGLASLLAKACNIPLFAHLSRVSDTKESNLARRYQEGMVLDNGARIISISSFDGVANVDMRPSILSRKALTIEEVEPGSIYDCRVLSHTALGSLTVAVDGDPYLCGVIPNLHVSDVPIPSTRLSKHPQLRIGSLLKCKVLNANVRRDKIYLTAKKSLVSPKYPLLTSYDQAKEALILARSEMEDSTSAQTTLMFTGTSRKVTAKGGLLVEFCTGVVGLVPSASLCLDEEKRRTPSDIESVYPIGETVHVKLVEADPVNRRLGLSMNLQVVSDGNTHESQVGEPVEGKITGINEQTKVFQVLISDNSRKLQEGSNADTSDGQPSAHGSNSFCHLPYGHLSDNPGLSERVAAELKKALSSGSDKKNSASNLYLKDLILLYSGFGQSAVSMKRSLRKAAREKRLPRTFEDIEQIAKKDNSSGKRKTAIRGYVKALLPGGIIVGFQGDLVGFVRKSRIANQFVSDPSRFVKMHQSCSVVVESTEPSQRRFSLSLRPSDVGYDEYESDSVDLFRAVDEWRSILDRKVLKNEFAIGSIIEAAPSSVRPFGTLYSLKTRRSSTTGIVMNIDETNPEVVLDRNEGMLAEMNIQADNTDGERPITGQKHVLRVLDVDPFSGVVDLSKDKSIVSGGRKKASLVVHNTVAACVVLVKDMYVVLSVQLSKGKSAIVFALGSTLNDVMMIRPGTSLKCKVLDTNISLLGRSLVAIDWESLRRPAHTGSEGKTCDRTADMSSFSLLKTLALQDDSSVVGMQISGKVTKVFPSYAHVGIGPGIVGQVHISKTFHMADDELQSLRLGPLTEDYASKYHLPETGTKIPEVFVSRVLRTGEEQSGVPTVLELTLRKELTNSLVEEGKKVIGFVKTISRGLSVRKKEEATGRPSTSVTLIAIGSNEFVSCADVDCLIDDESYKLEPGTPVVCMITKIDTESKRMHGTLSENGIDRKTFFRGIVQHINHGHGVKVRIPWLARGLKEKSIPWGIVDICDVSSDFQCTVKSMKSFSCGDIVQVRRALKLNGTGDSSEKMSHIWLTMRKEGEHSSDKDPLLTAADFSSLLEGSKLRGFVRAVDKKGCFVSIGRCVSAHVKLCDLSDDFVKDPKASFPVGQLVQGKLGKQKQEKGSLKVSLVLRKRPRRKLKEDDIQMNIAEGTKVSGVVRKVEAYGAIIEIENGRTALLHKSEADQDRCIHNAFEEWIAGQKITAIVISAENGKVKLGTKQCYFEAAGMKKNEIFSILAINEEEKLRLTSKDEGTHHMETLGTGMSVIGTEDEIASVDGEDNADVSVRGYHEQDRTADIMNEEEEGKNLDLNTISKTLEVSTAQKLVTPLNVSNDFFFDQEPTSHKQPKDHPLPLEEIITKTKPSEDKNSAHGRTSRDKREKKRQLEAAEREIRSREESIANNPDAPETAEDYERLLMGEPNNSVLWIRYMAFCLGLSQIDKARSVAERALKSICLEHEVERVNLWCSYVNLEAQFGMMNSKDPEQNDSLGVKRDAAVLRVFDRACERITDVMDFHLRIVSALRKSNESLSKEIMKRATRRFKEFEEVWIASGHAQFAEGDAAAARRTLERALITLDKQKHVAVILKFAQFEYKFGSPERGRTVFESLIGNFPKRLDLWNIYLDMEVGRCRRASEEAKGELVVQARGLFERLVVLDLSSKKMKFAFGKWLKFEKSFGRKENQLEVKNRARKYVNEIVSM